MWIDTLYIENCRSLKCIDIKLSPFINVFYGKNATGKTSLLESLHILSTGKSFRTSHIEDVISYSKSSIIISATVCNDDTNTESRIGIEKTKKKSTIRINKQNIFIQSELSRFLPLTVIHPLSVNLITGPPSIRRSYLDWICFYLFPDYHKHWKEYSHILKQRNMCLKDGKHTFALDSWTKELVTNQPMLISYRKLAVEKILAALKIINNDLFETFDIALSLQTGFPKSVNTNDTDSLLTYYQSIQSKDLFLRRTQSGIHSADYTILLNGKKALSSASRGELKLLSIALYVSQGLVITNELDKKSILLIDDLFAELDQVNIDKLISFFKKLKQQVIITCLDPSIRTHADKMFHVKHSLIEEE